MNNLVLLLPTYNRPERLVEVLEEFKGKNIYSDRCKLIVSINGEGCESVRICESYKRYALDYIEIYAQNNLLTYDQQIEFLFNKVEIGDYILFIGDKYDYSNVDFEYLKNIILNDDDFYVFKERFYQIVDASSLPYKKINHPEGTWLPGRSNYFPQVTMMSSVIFKKNKDVKISYDVMRCISNFSQIYLFLNCIGKSASYKALPFDFNSNRGAQSFKANWDESKGLEALIYLNENHLNFLGPSELFKLSLMRGMKKNGFFRYWNSRRPFKEKMTIWMKLIKSNPSNILLPFHSLFITLKKALYKCLKSN